MQRDAKLEVARWKQVVVGATFFVIGTVVVFWVFLFPLWILDGYVKGIDMGVMSNTENTIFLLGLGELFIISLTGGVFAGGFMALSVFKFYQHPSMLVDKERKMRQVESSGEIISPDERIVRGARLSNRPWPEIIEAAMSDGDKASKKIGKEGPLQSIMVAGSPFPYSYENIAMYIQGSAGSGKSQVIKQMIHDIRRRGGRDKLIIYDRKPEYLPAFYRKDDVIICPADRRHTPWDMFAEIKGEQDIDGVIRSLIPDSAKVSTNDKFWTDSARGVFRGILLYLMNNHENPSNAELCRFLFKYTSDPGKLWSVLKEDSAARNFAQSLSGAEGRTQSTVPTSVISTLTSYTNSFTRPEIAERGGFSIKSWLRDKSTEGQAVFLANPAKYEANYKSYFTVILDLALREMISLPNDNDRRVWFFIDEFGSLFKLDSVIRLLAEGRSKGACTVLGTQDKAQIEQQYEKEVETLLNNCSSKVLARIASYKEADEMSRLIGEFETEKNPDSSSVSFDDKSGMQVSLKDSGSETRRERRFAVMPAELMSLPALTYYAKFADKHWFRNQIEYYPWSQHELVADFLERPREFFDTRRITDHLEEDPE